MIVFSGHVTTDATSRATSRVVFYVTLRLPPLILRHVYASTANMKRRLRFPHSNTCAPPLFPHFLQRYSLKLLKPFSTRFVFLNLKLSETTCDHQKVPLFFIYGILNIFYRLHHPITVLCIRYGPFSLSLHCSKVSFGFSAFFCVFVSSSSPLSLLHSLQP